MSTISVRRHVVIPVLGLAVAGALSGVLMVASSQTSYARPGLGTSGSTPAPSMDAEMPGMDMGGSTPTPEPSMADDMPGMDMGGSTPTPEPTMDPDMPGMDMGGTGHEHGDTAHASSDRPLAPVLGTFGGGASAVMIGAGLLRRKDRAAAAAKQAARAARRAQK